MICTFFGHKDAPSGILQDIERAITSLIEKHTDIGFYVGHNGNFDRMVIGILRHLKKQYPRINYSIVIYDLKNSEFEEWETLYPEGLEKAPKRFAIDRRNTWMVNNSDIVISYITHSYGGAYKFFKMAEKKDLTIINLGRASCNESDI